MYFIHFRQMTAAILGLLLAGSLAQSALAHDSPLMSVQELPPVQGTEHGQVAVRWSGELPVTLEAGLAPGEGNLSGRVVDAHSQTLAQVRGGSPAFGWQPAFLEQGVSDSVSAFTFFQGDLIVAGSFVTAGDQEVNRIARWNGSEWSALSGPSTTGMDGSVSSLTVHDGYLVAGGQFTTAGGVAVNHIARWDGSEWSALAGPAETGVNSWVQSLTVYNGDLVAGGQFSTAGGVTVNQIASWDGTEWSALSGPSGIGVSHNTIWSLAVHDGYLVAGGGFTSAGGVTAENIARWDGNEWSAMMGTSGNGVNDTPYALTVFDGDLVVGGNFTTAGGVEANRIARWDGSEWSALPGTGMNNSVRVLAVQESDLLVGGSFTTVDGVTVNRVTRWDGNEWLALAGPSGTGINGTIVALAIHDGDLLAGGGFSHAGGEPIWWLARYGILSFTVGGTVSGLVGSGLVLQNNDGDDLPIADDGTFTFATTIESGQPYNVTILTQPDDPGQTCTVTNGSGNIDDSNVTDVNVQCELIVGLTLSDESLHFQVSDADDVSMPQSIQITSTGEADLVLGTLSLDGADPGEFVLASNDCDGQVLTPSQSCNVEIEFAPSTRGLASADLMVPSNDPDSPAVVSLTGATDQVFQDRFE